MSRRIVSYVLFCAVAVYATGLPQFVHVLVEHQGFQGLGGFGGFSLTTGGAAAPGGCCSHACPIGPQAFTEECDGQGEGGCDHTHDCSVCQMLATSFAAAAGSVKVTQLYGGVPPAPAAVSSTVYLSPRSGPHSPRGPPAHI